MSLVIATPNFARRSAGRARQAALRGRRAPRLTVVPAQAPPSLLTTAGVAWREARGEPVPPLELVRVDAGEPRVRLTPRARFVVHVGAAALLFLAVICAVLLVGRTAMAGEQPHPVPVSYRIVLTGETLWQIAGQVAPEADRRDTVDEIVELNGLHSAEVSAGQRIAVPVDVG
jgi:hypothetical protein